MGILYRGLLELDLFRSLGKTQQNLLYSCTMKRILYLFAFSFFILFIIGCEETMPLSSNQRELKPPPGNGYVGEVCLLVRNKAPFSITGRVQLKSRERSSFRLSRNESYKMCLIGELYGANTVSFVLTNYLTLPLFSCYTRTDRSIDVYARRRGDSWVYTATCRK